MPEPWSAGTFLARAKELSRRLRCWHIDSVGFPVQLCSLRESHAWVRRTFRAIVAVSDSKTETRPKVWQIFAHQESDEEGNQGETSQNPDRKTDRSLTQWLMGDYLRHLSAAPPHAALDYLKESFAQILDRPAWTVREPQDEIERAMATSFDQRGEPRVYIVTGCHMPVELLEVFCHAAEKLLSEAPPDWRAVAESPTPELDTREVPLEAPAGTPTPLKEAYESVAKVLFDAAEMRRDPPSGHHGFTEFARELAAKHGAAREEYSTTENLLLSATEDGRCAHRDALRIIRQIVDATGHVVLGSVPIEDAFTHLKAVPAFHIEDVLTSMRRQTSRATMLEQSGQRQAGERAAAAITSTEEHTQHPTRVEGEMQKGKRVTKRETLSDALYRLEFELKAYLHRCMPSASSSRSGNGGDSSTPPRNAGGGEPIESDHPIRLAVMGVEAFFSDTKLPVELLLHWKVLIEACRLKYRQPDAVIKKAAMDFYTAVKALRFEVTSGSYRMRESAQAELPGAAETARADSPGYVEVAQPRRERLFTGGQMVFFEDRVELCGVDICSGRRREQARKVLDLLRQKRSDGSFVPYSGDKLAERIGSGGGQNTAAGAIRDLRTRISG